MEGPLGPPPNSGRMVMPLASLDHGIFNLHLGVDEKILRSLLVFLFLAVALRLGGKREMGQLNVLDFAVLLLASNALQNALIGDDSTVTGGVIGASTLFIANYFFVRLTFRSAKARRILEGTPRILLRNGEADADASERRRSPRPSWWTSCSSTASRTHTTWASSCSRPMAQSSVWRPIRRSGCD